MKTLTNSLKTKIFEEIRLSRFLFIFIFWSGTTAFALDSMGPPATNIENGQFNIGADFTHSNTDLELNNGVWTEYLDGVFYDWGDAVDLKLKDFEINRGYVHLGYGICDNCEAFFRIGGSSAEFGDSIWEDSEIFESRTEPAFGFGLKATIFDGGNVKFGGLLQTNWAGFDGKLDAPHWAASDFVEVDMVEVQIAAGITVMLSDSVSIYCGPFAHFIDGELDDNFSAVDPGTGGLLTSRYLWDIEEESSFGGYFGTQMELSENCSLNMEFQHTASANAFGAGIAWRF
jgi:hypothetical protein